MEFLYAFREKDIFVDDLSAGRTKPWCTGHAVLCAAEHISSPFAVINTDNYYGKSGFVKAAEFLDSHPDGYGLIGYVLKSPLAQPVVIIL